MNQAPCLNENESVSVNIKATSKLEQIMSFKKAFLVRVPDRPTSLLIQEEPIGEALARDKIADFREIWGPLPAPVDGQIKYTIPAKSKIQGMSIFAEYLIIFCDGQQADQKCLKELDRAVFAKRDYWSLNMVYLLANRGAEVPRCDKKQLEFYFYPFSAGVGHAPHRRVSEKDKSLPSEIIDAAM